MGRQHNIIMDDNLNQNIAPVTEPVIANPVVQSPTPNTKSNRLLFILIFILALILGTGGTYLVLNSKTQKQIQPNPTPMVTATPTPDPTANWKTYTNAKYGYSVSYPKDWIIQNENLAVDSVTTKTKLQSADFIIGEPTMGGHYIPGAESGALLEIVVSLNPNFKSYEDFKSFEETKSTKFPLNYFSSVDNDAVIGGIKATKKLGGKPYKGWQSYAYTFDNGTIYEVYLTSSNNQQVLFDQILSSFKFAK